MSARTGRQFLDGLRGPREIWDRIHESPAVMTVPLAALGFLTVVTGWAVGIPSGDSTLFARFLAPVFPLHEGHHGGALLLGLSFLVVGAGIAVAFSLYKLGPVRAETVSQYRSCFENLTTNGFGHLKPQRLSRSFPSIKLRTGLRKLRKASTALKGARLIATRSRRAQGEELGRTTSERFNRLISTSCLRETYCRALSLGRNSFFM